MGCPEEYRIAIERQEKEADRYWMRSNVLLLVQGALISFYTGLDTKSSILGVMVAIEGLFLAIVWFGVLRKGKAYVSRWDSVIREIETSDAKLNASERRIAYALLSMNSCAKRTEAKPRVRLFGRSSTRLMQDAVLSVIVFWVITIAVSPFGLLDTKAGPLVEDSHNAVTPVAPLADKRDPAARTPRPSSDADTTSTR